jgi:hypothetical protein
VTQAKVVIDDLGLPKLTGQQQAALDYCATLTIELTPDSILAEARATSGLEDAGPDDALDRLALLCDEWRGDAELTNLGRLSLRNKLLQHATSRLLLHDLLTAHPEIHEVEIQRPIIVAGLPRSGTTHLLNLMAADTRLRSLPLWESYEPVPRPSETVIPGEVDPRYARCEQQWQMMQGMSPLLAAMHPMNPDHIHEELELMGPDFASYNYEWLSVSPGWRDYYYSTDQTPHYEYMKTVLKVLTWRDGDPTGENTRWVLKCPQHLEQLPVLHAVFPDAFVPITHRDPVSVIQSAVTMIAYGQRTGRTRIDLPAILEYWSNRVEHLLRACVKDRDKLPSSQSLDVLFHEFMADDLATVEAIYRQAGLPMTDSAREQLRGYLRDNPRGKHGQVVYRLHEDFGVDPAALRERFAFYFDQFAVKAEIR